MENTFECRPGCGACCIAPSISSPIPGMPEGKGRRSPLRESGPGVPLPDLSGTGASGGVRFAAGDSRNVRFLPGRGSGDPDGIGAADHAGRKWSG